MISLRALAAPMALLAMSACAEAPPPPPAAPTPPAPACATPVALAAQKMAEAERIAKVDVDGAVAAYGEAIQLDPRNHRAFFLMGLARRKQERWAEVEAAMARAVEIAPGFASYWMERGYALEMRARRKESPWASARAPFERCVALDPNLAACHEELGNVLLRLDDERGALESYTTAIARDPTVTGYYTTLAGLYLDLDRAGDAEAVLGQAERFVGPARPGGDRDRFNLHVLLARVHQTRGDTSAVVRELEAARTLAPPDGLEASTILWSLGSTYATMKPPRKAEAIELLKSFNARICRGARAPSFRDECEQTQALLSRLRGTDP